MCLQLLRRSLRSARVSLLYGKLYRSFARCGQGSLMRRKSFPWKKFVVTPYAVCIATNLFVLSLPALNKENEFVSLNPPEQVSPAN
jgi:hypothetical protein